ncbi:TAXI family TRAP transporter solute-binding subunit [Inquilinus sp. NPDC058860]|uniref:TAXI family TRAP transporter solute-binding subunit n=1 Tax=Inquilinus sp. NPDC058860 TaxID=3346652 RepID=UPI00367DEF3A
MPSSRAPLFAGLAAALLFGLAAPGSRAQDTAAQAAPPREIIVATAPVNSPLGRWGNAFVERLKPEAGQPVSEAITAGPLPNSALLQSGRVAIGLVSLDVAAAAWGGTSPMAPGMKFDHLRALAPVAPAAVLRFVVPAGSGITSASGLAGKRVALATDDALTEPMLKALDIKATLRRLPLTEVAKQFADAKIDAVAVTGLEPFALPPEQPAVTFGLTVAEIAKVASVIPGVAAAAVPLPPVSTAPPADPAVVTDPAAVPAPAALPPQPLPPSAGMWTWLVATDALPEEVARRATEIAVGQAAPLAEAAGLEASPALDPLTNRALPFHRGAAAAWAAHGVTVPADQVR